jgi:hypothetical protein
MDYRIEKIIVMDERDSIYRCQENLTNMHFECIITMNRECGEEALAQLLPGNGGFLFPPPPNGHGKHLTAIHTYCPHHFPEIPKI